MCTGRFMIVGMVLVLAGCSLFEGWHARADEANPPKNADRDGKSQSAGLVEMAVGQGGLVTLKKDLSRPPDIKVQNPAIADFVVLDKRRIRIVGKKTGRTELVVKTKPNESFRYVVHVVTPQDMAYKRLKKRFDGSIKVVRGQDHVLAFKNAIVGRGKPGLVAVGNPAIAEMMVLDSRRVRLIGKKAGLTDLLVITSNEKVFHYEVHVTAPGK